MCFIFFCVPSKTRVRFRVSNATLLATGEVEVGSGGAPTLGGSETEISLGWFGCWRFGGNAGRLNRSSYGRSWVGDQRD